MKETAPIPVPSKDPAVKDDPEPIVAKSVSPADDAFADEELVRLLEPEKPMSFVY